MNADTRRKIVMAAMDLFAEKGFQSTSVADILSRTQVHSGSLYHFFPGKQDVLAAVLEAYRDGIEEWLLAPAWSGVDDPVERIFALLNAYRTHAGRPAIAPMAARSAACARAARARPGDPRLARRQFRELDRRPSTAASTRPASGCRPRSTGAGSPSSC